MPGGRSVGYAYTNGQLTAFTDVRGKVWTYSYDGGGRLVSIVDPLALAEVTNIYGPTGRVVSQTDALGKATTFAWSAVTETTTVTDPNGKVWKDVYVDGVLQKEIDPLANSTEYVHDAGLSATEVKAPSGLFE